MSKRIIAFLKSGHYLFEQLALAPMINRLSKFPQRSGICNIFTAPKNASPTYRGKSHD